MKESKVVAWKNNKEWIYVYNLIFKRNDFQQALEILAMWQTRCEKIAWAVICTANYLAAKVHKIKNPDDILSRQNQLSSALAQFIGLAIEKEYKKGQFASMAYLGESIDIPEWVVELRHSCGHGKLPNLVALEESEAFCFEWLKVHYWMPQYAAYSEEIQRLELTSASRNALRQVVARYFSRYERDNEKTTPPRTPSLKILDETVTSIAETPSQLEETMDHGDRQVGEKRKREKSKLDELSQAKCRDILVDLMMDYSRTICDFVVQYLQNAQYPNNNELIIDDALQVIDAVGRGELKNCVDSSESVQQHYVSRLAILNRHYPTDQISTCAPLVQAKLINHSIQKRQTTSTPTDPTSHLPNVITSYQQILKSTQISSTKLVIFD